MLSNRFVEGVLAFENSIYVFGGRNEYGSLDTVEKFDHVTGKWTFIKSMHQKRHSFGVARLKEKIYVCGGSDYYGSQYLKSTEVYDPKTNTWTNLAEMNTKRMSFALLASKDKLFAIGGFNSGSNLQTIEMFDPKKKTPPNSSPF